MLEFDILSKKHGGRRFFICKKKKETNIGIVSLMKCRSVICPGSVKLRWGERLRLSERQKNSVVACIIFVNFYGFKRVEIRGENSKRG